MADLHFSKLHFILLVLYSIVSCCITGDEEQLDRIFPADANQVPNEDRPSIAQAPARFDIEMASPAQGGSLQDSGIKHEPVMMIREIQRLISPVTGDQLDLC